MLDYIWKGRARSLASEAIARADQKQKQAKSAAHEAAKQPASETSITTSAEAAADTTKSKQAEADALEAKIAAENSVLTERLELWETGLTELIRKEYKQWTERMAELVSAHYLHAWTCLLTQDVASAKRSDGPAACRIRQPD